MMTVRLSRRHSTDPRSLFGCGLTFSRPMRIAFLCGSQEAGRDGVGDYTSGLAEELRQQGHEVIVIGLRDKFVSQVTFTERHFAGGSLQTLRFPAALPWSECIELAGQQLDRFDPEWVSLQFVCYTFHPKGLVHGLAGKLAPLLAERKLHIMFHEIWLCQELGWGWKQCAVGALQRHFIQRFIRAASPKVMHTSNATYAALLNRSGIPVTELGLFGAIPTPSETSTAWIESQLRTALGDDYRREGVLLFGLFGALHAQWPPEPLLTHLHRAAQTAGKRPVLLSIGRTGDAGRELWNRIAQDYAGRFTFIRLGEQPTEHVSEYLSFLDCGIATTPRSIIGKSSSVISMLEHGLPVIVNRDDAPGVTSPPGETEPLLVACNSHLETRLQAGLSKGPRLSRRARIAKDFLLSLQAGGGPPVRSPVDLAPSQPHSRPS